MRWHRALLPGLLLCLAGPSACDCAGPVRVGEPDARARADASADAATLDVNAQDTTPVDASPPDGASGDSLALDTGAADSVLPDHGVGDLIAADQGGADAVAVDAAEDSGLADGPPDDAAISTDSGSADQATLDSAGGDGAAGEDGATDAGSSDAGSQVVDCSSGGLCLALTWNSGLGDLDLHLSMNGGAWCSDDACFWMNCAENAASHVDWDQSGGLSDADPVIYHEGVIGNGPELLRIADPLQGTYTAGVHYNPGPSLTSVTAVVELWSLGVKRATQSHTLAPGAFWELGDILVGASSVGLTPAARLCSSGQWLCQDAVHACPAE